MRQLWKILPVTIAAAALAVAGCSSSPGTPDRAALALPDASAFRTGTCATIAEPVLALGRFTYDKADARTLDNADREQLVARGEQVKSALSGAAPELADQMLDMLVAIGFVRIRVGDTYDPRLLAEVEAKRMVVQNSCTA